MRGISQINFQATFITGSVKYMGKIVAIGGGSMLENETLGIDQEVIALSDKECPKALFIPTASSDPF